MDVKRWLVAAMILFLGIFVVRFAIIELQSETSMSSNEGYIVYFGSSNDVGLVPEYRQGTQSINNRLSALLSGPESPELVQIFPNGTKIISYQQEDDILYVNFSRELLTKHWGGSASELITVYGLVNTLTEDPSVNYVQIVVEGRLVYTIAGHVDVSEPLSRDLSLLLSVSHI